MEKFENINPLKSKNSKSLKQKLIANILKEKSVRFSNNTVDIGQIRNNISSKLDILKQTLKRSRNKLNNQMNKDLVNLLSEDENDYDNKIVNSDSDSDSTLTYKPDLDKENNKNNKNNDKMKNRKTNKNISNNNSLNIGVNTNKTPLDIIRRLNVDNENENESQLQDIDINHLSIRDNGYKKIGEDKVTLCLTG
jgi:hypothetical protein